MKSLLTGFGMLLVSTAASAQTDFGVRVPPSGATLAAADPAPARLTQVAPAATSLSLASAVSVVSQLGRVTSTRRSVAHNRAVGGAPNSYHLRGRAIDIVPRRGVRHADIEAALRRAGFHLVESLDEGDHSHFAFGTAPVRAAPFQPAAVEPKEVTQWRMVTAPKLASR